MLYNLHLRKREYLDKEHNNKFYQRCYIYVIVQIRVGLLPIANTEKSWKHKTKPSNFNEHQAVLKLEEVFLKNFWTYFPNKLIVCKKIKKKAGAIFLISSSDFQTFSSVLIFLVLSWIINKFHNLISDNLCNATKKMWTKIRILDTSNWI